MPFSAIGADHGIEHENRAMKVMGGIRGLAYDHQALESFFLASPELNTIVEDFSDKYGLKSRAREGHYQLIGSSNDVLGKNLLKLHKMFESYSLNVENRTHLMSRIVLT